MLYTFLIMALIALILVLTLGRHRCDSVCGNVLITYPFGIGGRCAANHWFAITCHPSSPSSIPKPVLAHFNNLELIEIVLQSHVYIDLGEITVKMPLVKDCVDDNKTGGEVGWSSLDLTESPFGYSKVYNMFVSLGCDRNASLYGEAGQVLGGCSSSSCEYTRQQNQVYGQGVNGCRSNLNATDRYGDWYDSIANFSVVVMGSNRSCGSAFLISRAFLNIDYNATIAMAITHSAVPLVLSFEHHKKSADSKFIAISVVFGSPVAILLVSCGCWWSCWFYKTKERRKQVKLRAKYFKGQLGEQQRSSGTGREVIEKTKLYTIKELKTATDNFNKNRVLGEGGQGTVYKGMLSNGEVIAVKRSRTFDESEWRQFINEIILLSQINHRNIVKLLGCCLETPFPLVVYEFISNGTLSQHIQASSANDFVLTWENRLRVACEAAGAINYLHSSSSVPIYHRDIKSTNILLDEKYQAKVSDFGISKAFTIDQTHLTTCVRGTFGYLDPEYFRSSQFTEKSDVYSFGVILVELLTGQQPIRVATQEEEKSLVVYFLSSMEESTLESILDPVVVEGSSKENVELVAHIAKRCLNSRGIERPTMKQVFIELERLRKKVSSNSILLQEVLVDNENVASSSSTLEIGG